VLRPMLPCSGLITGMSSDSTSGSTCLAVSMSRNPPTAGAFALAPAGLMLSRVASAV